MTEPLIPDWRHSAACKGHPTPEIWFVATPAEADDAKQVCARCPVRLECGEHAYRTDERFGVAGGYLTEDPDDWNRLTEWLGVENTRLHSDDGKPRIFTCQCGREVEKTGGRNLCTPCSTGLIDAGPAIEQVARLRRIGGMTLRQIAAETGLSKHTIGQIPHQQYIRRTTAERLLAVTGEATADRS